MAYVSYEEIAPIIEQLGWQALDRGYGDRGNWTSFACHRPEYQLVFFGHDSDQLVELGLYEVSNPNRQVEVDKICLSDAVSPGDFTALFLNDINRRYINV